MASDSTSDSSLDVGDLDADPILQFGRWFGEAVNARLVEAEAMCVATARPDGTPSARMVLMKSYDERGFVFYTNYESQKALEMAENPNTALVWWWQPLRRQVRVSGRAALVTPEESDRYFVTRDRESQLAAWASPQSGVLTGRDVLDQRVAAASARFAGRAVPRPPSWGGIRVEPAAVEFWQGRPHRLHDRFRYARHEAGWRIERLAP